MSQFILASQSPRRQQILQQLGYQFDVVVADIDETPNKGESPLSYVQRMAMTKASNVAAEQSMSVLAADTIVVIDDIILGKPIDKDDAVSMLTQLSGRRHQVITACTLASATLLQQCYSCSEVQFRALNINEILSYWESGEPADKAGAYGIQGLASVFIENLNGSYSGVMGLPSFEVSQLLAQQGIFPSWLQT